MSTLTREAISTLTREAMSTLNREAFSHPDLGSFFPKLTREALSPS